MADTFGSSLEAAWNELWQEGGRFEMVPRIRRGGHEGHHWFRAVTDLDVRNTGPVVLLNSEPWGIVSLNLMNNRLNGVDTIEPQGFEYDADSGQVTAKIRFSGLTLSGDYKVTRGEATSSGVKMALATLGTSDQSGIALSKDYQGQLAESDSGRTMLSSYYEHNDSYADCFNSSATFRNYWKNFPTNDKTTVTFANQTTNAAQSGNSNTVKVNGDPDYNVHSFSMQGFLVSTANGLQHHAAALAASQFKSSAQPVSSSEQTVDDVLNIVKTTSPPSTVTAMTLTESGEFIEEEDDYSWVPEDQRSEYRERHMAAREEIRRECRAIVNGEINLEDTLAPILGTYESRCATPVLTLSGSARLDSGGKPTIEFSSLSGDIAEFSVELDAFPGRLHSQLQEALNKARFLHSVLGRRCLDVLNQSPLLSGLATNLSLAVEGD